MDDESLEPYLASVWATYEQLDSGASFSGHERNCVFLNTDGASMANVSSVTGLDFPDDGRGMAMVDWDHDGDLDIWLSNRNAPRLRFMKNNLPTRNFLSIRLRGNGLTCNRDAIGARVTVHSGDNLLVRTVYAGDGFLSQSSKWLQFGLGHDTDVSAVTVRWPSGETEEFDGVLANRRLMLVQGEGKAVEQSPRQTAVRLSPSKQTPVEVADASAVVLPSRPPLPQLDYRELTDDSKDRPVSNSSPLLVVMWASWCTSCVEELETLTARQSDLRSSGLEVLALNVDHLSQDTGQRATDVRQLLARIRYPYQSGLASAATIEKIEVVERFLFDRRFPFAVPLSLLLDRQGRLAAIYRGPVEIDTLLDHVSNLETSPRRWRDLSVPLAGRWYTEPEQVNPRTLAKWFEQRHPHDSERLLHMSLAHSAAQRQATGPTPHLDFEFVEAHRRLAVICERQEPAD